MSGKINQSHNGDGILLAVLLILGFVHAMFYVFFIPPWYHHDEPSHFEYVLLIAKLGRIPEETERQQEIAVEIGKSMIETGFSSKMGGIPDLNPQSGEITQIGFSQLGGPPLYYLIASLPVRLFMDYGILVQLHVARVVSSIFYLINILAAWGIARELFPGENGTHSGTRIRHFMHFAVPGFLVLWPGHVDIMTAVNSDAPAIAFSGMALWGTTRTLRSAYTSHRMDWVTMAVTVIFVGLAVAFKETAVVIFPAVLVGFVFSSFASLPTSSNLGFGKFLQRWLAWLVLAIGAILGVILFLRFDDAANWIRLVDQESPIRNENTMSPDGNFVGALSLDANRFPVWHVNLYQSLARDQMPDTFPATFSFGTWMWADQPLEVDLPAFAIGPGKFTRRVQLTTQPQFLGYAFTLESLSSPTIRIVLKPKIDPPQPVRIYFDGMVLADGLYAVDQAPIFNDKTAASGQWGGKPFTNLIRNGSFEQPGVRFSAWLDRAIVRFVPDQSLPSAWLQASLDWAGFRNYFTSAAEHLFRTFWARFGWGNIPLVHDFPIIGLFPYRKISYLSIFLVGLSFAALALKPVYSKHPNPISSSIPDYPAIVEIVFIFFITIILAWGMALLRGSLYTGLDRLFYPVARYALPAVVPTLLILLTGWGVVTEYFQIRFGWSRLISIIIFLIMMLFLNALSLVSIFSFISR